MLQQRRECRSSLHAEFLPVSGPLLLLLPPPRLPTPPALVFSLSLSVISSVRLSLTTVYVLGFPSSPATLHDSQNLRQFVVLCLPVPLVCQLLQYKLREGKNSVCIDHVWTLSSIYLQNMRIICWHLPNFCHRLPHLVLLTTLREMCYDYVHFGVKGQSLGMLSILQFTGLSLNLISKSGLFLPHHMSLCAWHPDSDLFFFFTFYFEIISTDQKASRLVQRTPVYSLLKFTRCERFAILVLIFSLSPGLCFSMFMLLLNDFRLSCRHYTSLPLNTSV